jgi:hypothetical protein
VPLCFAVRHHCAQGPRRLLLLLLRAKSYGCSLTCALQSLSLVIGRGAALRCRGWRSTRQTRPMRL